MKKYLAVVASTALSLVTLVGCGGGSDYCDAATEEDAELISNVDPSSPDSLREAADRLDELAGDAPDEIKGDIETARDTFRQIADANGDPDKLANIDSAAITEAGTNLASWEEENC